MSTSTGMASQSQSAKKTAEAASSSSEPVSTAEQTAFSASSATELITNATNSTNLNLHENFNTSANISLIGGLPSGAAGISNNTSAAASTDNYTVSLMSGDEFLLSRKEVLLEVITQHLQGVRERANAVAKDVDKCTGEVFDVGMDVNEYKALLERAEENQREAAESVRRSREALDEVEKEQQASAAKLKDLEQTAAEIGAEVARVKEVLENAKNAASADIMKELIEKLDEGSHDEKHEEADQNGKPEHSDKNGDRGSSNTQDKPLAGKRSRQEDDFSAGGVDVNEEEHRRKESKWDTSEVGGGGSGLLGVTEVDADLGLVFNSPGKDDTAMILDNASADSTDANGANEFTISVSAVRLHVHRALSERRSKQNLRALPDVMDLIFCVHKTTGEVFSNVDGDTPAIPESVLLGGDLVVGVRNIPALDFSVIMRPFSVISRVLCGEEHDAVAEATNGERNGQADNENGSNSKQTKWWEIPSENPNSPKYSERTAVEQVAYVLGSFPGDRERYHNRASLIGPFFRHYWPEWHNLSGSEQEDLKFALSEVEPRRGLFGVVSTTGSCMFPTAAGIKVADFQREEEEGEALTRLFPRFSAQLVAGLRGWSSNRNHSDDGHPDGLKDFLCFLTGLSATAPALLSDSGPWSWPPLIPEPPLGQHFRARSVRFEMPLFTTFRYDNLPKEHLRHLILDLFKYAQREASRQPKSDPKSTLYWNLKQCLVQASCRDEENWISTLTKKEGWLKDQVRHLSQKGMYHAELALFQAVRRIEGAFARPEKKGQLRKETVLQLDL